MVLNRSVSKEQAIGALTIETKRTVGYSGLEPETSVLLVEMFSIFKPPLVSNRLGDLLLGFLTPWILILWLLTHNSLKFYNTKL